MNNDFDYEKYQLAVSIYQYAERVVTDPKDDLNITYLRNEAYKALDTCRKENIGWSPLSTKCKGKRLAGRLSIEVSMNPDTAYGFAHYPENAGRIYNILLDMWKKYIHQEELETVLDLSYQSIF